MRSTFARTFVASLAFLAVSGVAAQAADLPTRKGPPPAPALPAAYDWTGFYVGAEAGGAWSQSRAFYPIAGPTGYLPYDPSGIFGGVYAGYNYEFASNIVVGVESDINYGDIRHGTYYHVSAGGSLPTDTGDGQLGWFGSARLRAGYAFDRFLPFVTGGVAFADYKSNLNAQTNPLFNASDDHTRAGWTVGGGLDYALTNNLTLRAEYRYADYGNVTDVAANLPITVHTVDLKTNDVRVGVAYKF
jgi:outer membrane immunogenic protein